MATKVSKNLITSVDPSQLTTTGATAGQVLTYNASTTTWVASAAPGSAGGSITSGTAVTLTNQTSVDFTSIPSTAKRVTVLFNGASTNGITSFQIQIGSGSIDATNYKSLRSNGATSSTTGILATAASTSANTYTGTCVLTLVGSNTWSGSSVLLRDDNNESFYFTGYKTITGSLDRLRITTASGTDQFDVGTVNIMWE